MERVEEWTRADVARFWDFMLKRMENLQRLSTVTDPVTMARYYVGLHMEMRPAVDALRVALDESDDVIPHN